MNDLLNFSTGDQIHPKTYQHDHTDPDIFDIFGQILSDAFVIFVHEKNGKPPTKL